MRAFLVRGPPYGAYALGKGRYPGVNRATGGSYPCVIYVPRFDAIFELKALYSPPRGI